MTRFNFFSIMQMHFYNRMPILWIQRHHLKLLSVTQRDTDENESIAYSHSSIIGKNET